LLNGGLVILTSGCFDGIHAGHIAFFQKLQQIVSQPVYVAVAPDEYIRRTKGREPRWKEADRLAAVKGLKGVYEAFLHDAGGVYELARRGHPKTLVHWTAFAKGIDWIEDESLHQWRPSGLALMFVDSESDLHSSTR
jgi:cytidyltransferase-like protein